MNRHILYFAIAASLLVLNACTVLQPAKRTNMKTYTLDVQFDAATSGGGKSILLVTTPKALPGLNSSRMLYMRRAHEVEYFAENQWVDSPPRMLAPLLVDTLERTGEYSAVVQVRSATKADYRLETEILRFQQEFLTQPSQIHLMIRAQMFDIEDNNILGTQVFDITEVAAGDDPYAGVAAMNHAVKTALEQIVAFCRHQTGLMSPQTKNK